MILYGISGLGADERIFQYLNLDYELISLNWIDPAENETIEDYSSRLAKKINTNEKFGLLGVSFGGLIVVEISKQLNPAFTILISSAETKYELRTIYRILGKAKLLNWIPNQFFKPHKKLANWIFGIKTPKQKILLSQILDDTDLSFAKWAINTLINWQNEKKQSNPKLKIGGTNDKLLPPKRESDIYLIEGGTHFMIVNKAEEISQIINKALFLNNYL